MLHFLKNIIYGFVSINFVLISRAFATDNGTKDVKSYQDEVPYDNFLYKDGQKKLSADQDAESGKYWGVWVTKRGKLYVIDSDMKLSRNVNWGNDVKPVISDSWSNTSISIILIKHPQNKPITIEGTNKQTITLGKGIILDIQSPVIFKNVRIHRAQDAPDSGVYRFETKKVCQLGSYGLYSSAVVVRAPIKFENCILSTSNDGGTWSDVHCTTPGNSTMEFYNNTYQIKHMYINCNSKGAAVPIFKTNEKSKLQPLISAISGNRNNIAMTPSMLTDLNSNSNISYIPIGNFNQDNGKVLYVTSSLPDCIKNENRIWYGSIDDVTDLSSIKQKCVQFLKKYCNYPSDKNDINVEVCNTSLTNAKTLIQLMSETGYIDTDMSTEGDHTFPTTDWGQTIKMGVLPLSTSTDTAEINIGLIGKRDLKIQSSPNVHSLRINGDWSQYSGTLTLSSNISKVCVSGKDIPFGVIASHDFEISTTNQKVNELYITGDFSKCTSNVSFPENVSKIYLSTDKPAFLIGGNSMLAIGTTNPEITTMTLKSGILNRNSTVSIDTNIKTVSIE